MNISDITDALEGPPRHGAAVDDPEGLRHVVSSDTAMQRIARELRLAACERPHVESFGTGKGRG